MPVRGRTETFDTFIVGVENLSTKAIVKDMMNRKREELLKVARQASLLDQHEGAREDDELLELAAGGDMASGGPEDEDEDEELLELAGIKAAGDHRADMSNGDQPSAGNDVAGMDEEGVEDDDDDDDPEGLGDEELLELLFEHEE